MGLLRFVAFLVLACGVALALPFVPAVGARLGAVACEPNETFEWKQTSAGTQVSHSWVCVDPQGRFNVSDTSVRTGEVTAFGLSFAAGCAIAALPFVIGWAIRRFRRGA